MTAHTTIASKDLVPSNQVQWPDFSDWVTTGSLPATYFSARGEVPRVCCRQQCTCPAERSRRSSAI